ncbi:unnamed protein product [Gongylonema pulchrum]|uniref:Coatomer subunit epsilon-1-like n=1 Tax=Gongylonema pulchrum TaxID=637853 RepID=A0A183D9T8_9BILA|nr:unnamed protein product [Gongylonema pulchrum]
MKETMCFLFQTCNNAAICLLYKGEIVSAAEMLKNYPDDLNEPVAINFFTIAELSFANFAQHNVAFFANH